jgi:hypothetical protein
MGSPLVFQGSDSVRTGAASIDSVSLTSVHVSYSPYVDAAVHTDKKGDYQLSNTSHTKKSKNTKY